MTAGIPNGIGGPPDPRFVIVKYEADGDGRMYVHYANGAIYPARSIMSRFADRSDVTPAEFDAEKAAAKRLRDGAKTGWS